MEIDGHLWTVRHCETGWAGYFAALGVEPFRIVYEDFADDYESTMRAVFEYLSLPADPIPPPELDRQADEISQEWVERYLHPSFVDRVRMAAAGLRRGLSW